MIAVIMVSLPAANDVEKIDFQFRIVRNREICDSRRLPDIVTAVSNGNNLHTCVSRRLQPRYTVFEDQTLAGFNL